VAFLDFIEASWRSHAFYPV